MGQSRLMERAGKLPRRESGAGIVRDGVVAKKETRGSYGVRSCHDAPEKERVASRGTRIRFNCSHPLSLISYIHILI